MQYAIAYAGAKDINSAIDELGLKIGECFEKGFELQGGASVSVNNGFFYIIQTMVKYENKEIWEDKKK